MSEFEKVSSEGSLPPHSVVKLHASIKSVPPRGGSALVQLDDGTIVAFGGADREQCHFQDLIVYCATKPRSLFEPVRASGDVPTPRTGHSLAAYGRFVLLFGGLDFSEEAAYNDLYLLDTVSWQWSYVGEAGVEVLARNSHAMTILDCPNSAGKLLVIYGGASPERGTLSDTVYALLPEDPNTIDSKTFFVVWKQLSEDEVSPGPREMHGVSKVGRGQLLVSGGRRSDDSPLLDDIWVLTALPSPPTVSSSSSATTSSSAALQWTQLTSALSSGRCSHGSVVLGSGEFISADEAAAHRMYSFVVLGGFSEAGILGAMDLTSLRVSDSSLPPAIISSWKTVSLEKSLGARFGQAFCAISLAFVLHLFDNERYRPVLSSQKQLADIVQVYRSRYEAKDYASVTVGVVIFGGVNADQDFADVWMTVFSPV